MNMSIPLPTGLLRIWEQARAALDVVRPQASPPALAPSQLAQDLIPLCETLLARREENAGLKLVAEILDRYQALGEDDRCRFLNALADNFGPDQARLESAITGYQASPDDLAYRELQAAIDGLTVPAMLDYVNEFPLTRPTAMTLGPAPLTLPE